mmetsp:Transcript_101497/g.254435  ORF Transcript_101497/g.254435 Transcript_101497/m.254435 type:complete len:305 (+) Transcript_101497:1167-2081(+)
MVHRLSVKYLLDATELGAKSELGYLSLCLEQFRLLLVEARPKVVDTELRGLLGKRQHRPPPHDALFEAGGLRGRRGRGPEVDDVALHGAGELLHSLGHRAQHALARQVAAGKKLAQQTLDMGFGPAGHVAHQDLPPLRGLRDTEQAAQCRRCRRVDDKRQRRDAADHEQHVIRIFLVERPLGPILAHQDGQGEADHASKAAPRHDQDVSHAHWLAGQVQGWPEDDDRDEADDDQQHVDNQYPDKVFEAVFGDRLPGQDACQGEHQNVANGLDHVPELKHGSPLDDLWPHEVGEHKRSSDGAQHT